MNRLLTVVAFGLTVTVGTAVAAPPSPSSSPNTAVMARAKDFFHRIETGDIDRSQLTPQVNSQLTNAMIKQIASQVAPLGEPTSFREIQHGKQGGSEYYVYVVTFPDGDKWNYLFVFEAETGKISGLRITPAP